MFHTIDEAIEELKQNRMVIVVDDEDRENEGDFIMPAACVTAADVNFMATNGKGLICAPLAKSYAQKFDLPLMVTRSKDSMQTAFTVSVDAALHTSTGISAIDRAVTLKLLSDFHSQPLDFVRPGHIFPLIAKEGGVLERAGHTEAAVDLAKLAGFPPVGVICEILNQDGSCARVPQLKKLAAEHNLKIITIESLIKYLEDKPFNKTQTQDLNYAETRR